MSVFNSIMFNTIYYYIAAIFVGCTIGNYLSDLYMESSNPMFLTFNLLIGFISLCLSFIFNIFIYEIGRLIFGLMTGYKFLSFRISNTVIIRKSGKLTVKKNKSVRTSGNCVMLPPVKKNGKIPYYFYNKGGAILNFLLLPWYALFYSKISSGLLEMIVELLMIISITSIAISVFGGSTNNEYITDKSYNAALFKRKRKALQAFYIEMKIYEKILNGVRLQNLSDKYFEILNEYNVNNCFMEAIEAIYYKKLIDMHEFDRAKIRIEKILEADKKISDTYKCLLTCDYIYCQLVSGNIFKAKKAYTNEIKKLMNSMKKNLTVIRTRYSYALLVDDSISEAGKQRKLFDRLSKKYPYKVEIGSEKELIDIVYSKYYKILHQRFIG